MFRKERGTRLHCIRSWVKEMILGGGGGAPARLEEKCMVRSFGGGLKIGLKKPKAEVVGEKVHGWEDCQSELPQVNL